MNYCQNCAEWRAKPGLKPERRGHCALYNREVDAIGGEFCSAFRDKPKALEDHGRAVENYMLAKHPNVI